MLNSMLDCFIPEELHAVPLLSTLLVLSELHRSRAFLECTTSSGAPLLEPSSHAVLLWHR
jgi:hypothetical protein